MAATFLRGNASFPLRLGHPAMRLRALVELRRIEVLALHGAYRTRHVAVTDIRDARQGGGKVEQEGVTAFPRQRSGRIENGTELGVAQFDRRHAAGPRDG
jgi:hypothetical protein